MKLEIEKITVLTREKQYETPEKEAVFNDVRICIDESGDVYVSADKTMLNGIQISFLNSYFTNAYLLCDAWERGYGNLAWNKTEEKLNMPWYFAAKENEKLYCLGVKTQTNSFCSWNCRDRRIELCIDLRSGTNPLHLAGRRLKACSIVAKDYTGNEFDALTRFCKCMCDFPRTVSRPIFGGNDWYCNYGESSYEKIISLSKKIAACSVGCDYKPYMVIDDGWELCQCRNTAEETEYNGGAWKYSNQNFGDMEKLAQEMEKLGVIPGIWFRPMLTAEKVSEKCVMRLKGTSRTLDISVKEALDFIADDIKTLKRWGYRLIKHDFSTYDIWNKWGSEIDDITELNDTNFADQTKTTAEIIKNFYATLRDAAGDEVLLMGCNTISHLSAGIFDIQRTGDDTSGVEWERTKNYGINTLAFRMPQHNTFYAADADCVGITTAIPWEKNRQWLDVLSKSATVLFVSIADDAYSEEVKKDITAAFERICKNETVSVPLDWMENPIPCVWKSSFGIDKYNW